MFKVGDEVVCVDARPLPGSNGEQSMCGLRAGEVYRIACMLRGSIGISGLTPPFSPCHGCGQAHYGPWRFVKLPKQTVEHEETAEA